MDNLAQNYQPLESTSLDGLEKVFEVREQDANQDDPSSSVREQDASWLTVEQAAQRLGISVRAVQKRLTKGALIGFKKRTNHGERWFVEVREQDTSRNIQDANRDDLSSSVREQDASWNIQDANQDDLSSSVRELTVVEVDHRQDQLVRELLAKVEALTYRNGYLEAQLESERNQVKLLTDSQHKPKWWHRFRSWFALQ